MPQFLNETAKVAQSPETEFILNKLVKPDSYVLQEINPDTGKVQTIYEYAVIKPKVKEELENMRDGFLLLPKWCVAISILGLIGISIILIASLIVVFSAKLPALHGESCAHRSCLTSLNLKCINSTCECESNYYYTNKCLYKKDYMEKCHSSLNMCQDNKNLACYDGACRCLETQFWNGLKCTSRYAYTKGCRGDQCLTTLMLDCDASTGRCLCNSSRFWDGTVCALKRTIMESCPNSIECDDRQKLSCINSTCTCTTRQYFDPTYKICLNSLYENVPCAYTYQCLTPMKCNNSVCQCNKYEYYDNSTMTCKPQTLYNTSCSNYNNCRIDKGLTCQSGVCLCASSTPLWSITLNQCTKLLTYGETNCTTNSDCNSNFQLQCVNTTQTNNCSCPLTTQVSMCDCLRTYGNEYFWNGSSCVPALAFGQPCTAGLNYMCRTITEGTICDGTCTCPTDSYFNSSFHCFQCPNYWSFTNDICFKIFDTTSVCWTSAQYFCGSQGGKLVQFSNSTIFAEISNLLSFNSFWVGARGFPNGGGCGSGCPIQWFPSGGCNSCGANSSISCGTCTSGSCASGSCNCGSGNCGCGGSTAALNWCSGSSSTSNNCLLYDKTASCFKDAACIDPNYFICEYP